jgi:hypothetical protein
LTHRLRQGGLWSGCGLDDRESQSRLGLRWTLMDVAYQLQRCSCRRRGAPSDVRLLTAPWDEQSDPVGLSGWSGHACHRCLSFALTTLVAPMVVIHHEQIERLVGDVALTTREGGSDEGMHHRDQRRGPDKGIARLKHPWLPWCKRPIEKTCGTMEPPVSLAVMRLLFRGVRWLRERRMLPREHQPIARLLRPHGQKWGRSRCHVRKRDDHSVEVRLHRCEDCRKRGLVERVDHGSRGASTLRVRCRPYAASRRGHRGGRLHGANGGAKRVDRLVRWRAHQRGALVHRVGDALAEGTRLWQERTVPRRRLPSPGPPRLCALMDAAGSRALATQGTAH